MGNLSSLYSPNVGGPVRTKIKNGVNISSKVRRFKLRILVKKIMKEFIFE